MMGKETSVMGASHIAAPLSWNNGHHRVQVRLLQVYPVQPDSRQSDRTRRFALDDARPNIILGRASRNRSLIPAPSNLWLESPIITKEHARFIRGPTLQQPLLLRDLHSTHGTQVAGVKISSDTPVSDGDLLTFGDRITNGPLHFEPPTFMVEYDVTPLIHPPTPNTSSPPSAVRSTTSNHFEVPDLAYISDDDSLDELISTRAAPDSMTPSMASQEKEVAELFSDDEPVEIESRFTVQVPVSDTSDNLESERDDSVDEDCLAELEDDVDHASRMSLPPTQARYPQSTMAMPRLSVEGVYNIQETNMTGSRTVGSHLMEAPSVHPYSGMSADNRSFRGGSSAEHPILLDGSEPSERMVPVLKGHAEQRQSSMQEREARMAEINTSESAAISLTISSLLPIAELDNLPSSQRQPSPSDAALAKSRALTDSSVKGSPFLAESDYMSWFGTDAAGQPGLTPGLQADTSQPPGIAISQHSQSHTGNIWRHQYNDGPFKASEQTRPRSPATKGRSRPSGLAIEELIHPPGNISSLKRSRDGSEYEDDDEESITSDCQPLPRPSRVQTASGFKSFKATAHKTSAAEQKPRPRQEYTFLDAGTDVLRDPKSDYDSEYDDDALEVDDDDFGYGPDPEMTDESHERRGPNSTAANSHVDCMKPADAGDELGTQQAMNEHVPADIHLEPVIELSQQAYKGDLDAFAVPGPVSTLAQSLDCELLVGNPGHVELDIDQLLGTDDGAMKATKGARTTLPKFADFSGTAAGTHAATLSQNMTRGGQQVVADKSEPPRKKVKIAQRSQSVRRPRFRRLMDKAVPFVAGAFATAATIFVGAGVLISTIHDEIRQEALQEMRL